MSTVFDDDPELQQIRLRLQSDDGEVRRIALLDLTDLAGDEHAPLFIDALRDPVAPVRAEAAKALEAFESDAAVDGLIALLSDSDETVRHAAAQSLSELKLPGSARLLLPHTSHPDIFGRVAIFRGLRELRAEESLAPALRALKDQHPAVRREAVTVLGYLKRTEAIDSLTALASGDSDAEVRRAAVGALSFAAGNGIVAAALLSGLRDRAWQVREESATTLGKLGLRQAEHALIDALRDEYWQVRLRAARSLGRLKSACAVTALIEVLAHEISNLRKEAALALGEIRDVAALAALEAAQNDADPEVRKAVRLAIQQLGAAPGSR